MNADAIFAKTDLGKSAISDRCVPLSPKQRQLLIMIDGKRRLQDIFPTLDDTTVARINSLVKEGLIIGDKKPEAGNATTFTITELPNSAALSRIRGVLAMCSRQYMDDALDTMLEDVFDQMASSSELEFCLQQWLKRMQASTPSSATNLYISQIKSLL